MEWNRAFERLYELENVLGQSIWETVYSRDEAPQIAEAIAAVLEGEAQEGVEWTHRRPDGSLSAALLQHLSPARRRTARSQAESARMWISARSIRRKKPCGPAKSVCTRFTIPPRSKTLSFEQKMDALLATGAAQFGLRSRPPRPRDRRRPRSGSGVVPRRRSSARRDFPCRGGDRAGGAGNGASRRTAGAAARKSALGAPVRVNGEVWGTLCFAGFLPEPRLFTSGDREMIRLMAQWIGGEIAPSAGRRSRARKRGAVPLRHRVHVRRADRDGRRGRDPAVQ